MPPLPSACRSEARPSGPTAAPCAPPRPAPLIGLRPANQTLPSRHVHLRGLIGRWRQGLGVAGLAGLVVLGSSVGATGLVAIAHPALRPRPGWRRPGKPTYPDQGSPLTFPTERPAGTRDAPAWASVPWKERRMWDPHPASLQGRVDAGQGLVSGGHGASRHGYIPRRDLGCTFI